MLATVPNTLDVDGLGQVPDDLVRVDRIVVLAVHDTGVVELDMSTMENTFRAEPTRTSKRPKASTAFAIVLSTSSSMLTSHLIDTLLDSGYWLFKYSAALIAAGSLMSAKTM